MDFCKYGFRVYNIHVDCNSGVAGAQDWVVMAAFLDHYIFAFCQKYYHFHGRNLPSDCRHFGTFELDNWVLGLIWFFMVGMDIATSRLEAKEKNAKG
jgi:hypothetical protein